MVERRTNGYPLGVNDDTKRWRGRIFATATLKDGGEKDSEPETEPGVQPDEDYKREEFMKDLRKFIPPEDDGKS